MQARRVAAGVVAALVAGLASGSAAAGTQPSASASSGFDHPGRNVYFPLVPGTVSRYRGSADGERFRETVTVTRRHRTIQGVRTTVVLDVLRRLDGTLAERTHDWYATDDFGNVWYFGEATATYDRHGVLEDREGSWQSGVRRRPARHRDARIAPSDGRLPPGVRPGQRRGPGVDRPARHPGDGAVRGRPARPAQLRVVATRAGRAVGQDLRTRPRHRRASATWRAATRGSSWSR